MPSILPTLMGLLIAGLAPTGSAQQNRDNRIQILERAAALIEQNDFGSAEAALAPLVTESSDDAVALNLLGLIRMRQQNIPEAESLFERAIGTGHKIAGPYVNLALVFAPERPLDALHELKEALTIAPGNEQAQALLRSLTKESASRAIRSGKNNEAVALVVEARRIRPNDPEILYEFGMVTFEAELYKDAQAALEEALQIRPDYTEARYALARVYLNESLAGQAEQEMRDYLAAKPDDASAQYGLGYILMAEQKLDDAKQAFQRSLQLQPKQTESLFQLGEIALQQGQTDKARKMFLQVLASDSRHAGALTELGVIAFRSAKYAEAKSDLRQAVAAAPNFQKAHYFYALTLSKTGDKEQAESEFATARQLQKKHLEDVRINLSPQ